MMRRLILMTLLLGMCATSGGQKNKRERKTPTLSRGWGEKINWATSYEDALNKSKDSNKPLMVIHHLEQCPYSQALKKAFAANKAIQKMAKEDFVMLNIIEETTDPNLAPDGRYVPRIVFIDPSHTVRAELKGIRQNSLYTYKPEDLEKLAENMKTAKVLLHTEL